MTENFSLFGWPVAEPREKAGRPEHEPTDENRLKVMMLLAFGKTSRDIGAALGISQPTLRRYYFQELAQRRVARLQLEGQRFAAVYHKAIVDKDSTMLKELGKMLDRNDLEEIQRRFGEKQEPERRSRTGKKEEAKEAAATAGIGSEWGDDLAPNAKAN